MREPSHQNPEYVPWALEAAILSGTVANYCDHAEHVEASEEDRKSVIEAAVSLRGLAITIVKHESQDLQALYADRIEEVENRHPTVIPEEPKEIDGKKLILEAKTWRDLQRAQVAHNRFYNPDVLGLSRNNQLRHYALHLAKLGKSLAEQAQGTASKEDFIRTRLPDMVIFSILISVSMNEALPEQPFTEQTASS